VIKLKHHIIGFTILSLSQFLAGQVTDIDGNVYNTVTIGTQVWMKENLKTTKLNDGTAIPNVTDNTSWAALTTPGYCWYNNDASTYKATYGALYNWYAVNTGKLCPLGWRVPLDEDFKILTNLLGGYLTAGGKLKETGTLNWENPNTDATNEFQFTALPGGGRGSSGSFFDLKIRGLWWSPITDIDPQYSLSTYLIYNDGEVHRMTSDKKDGFSVRCIDASSSLIITSLTQYSGPVGATVTINGQGFSSGTTSNKVWFGAAKSHCNSRNIKSADSYSTSRLNIPAHYSYC